MVASNEMADPKLDAKEVAETDAVLPCLEPAAGIQPRRQGSEKGDVASAVLEPPNDDVFAISWSDPLTDPRNPLNWSLLRQWTTIALVTGVTLIPYVARILRMFLHSEAMLLRPQ